MTLPENLIEKVEQLVSLSFDSSRTIAGGSINYAASVSFKNGSSFFVKWNDTRKGPLLKAERTGLAALRASQAVVTPDIIAFDDGVTDSTQVLILELLSAGKEDRSGSRVLGQQLAALHQWTGDHFGFQEDNFIGELPQINIKEKHWGTFFRRYRLEPQGEIGKSRGWLRNAPLEDFLEVLPNIEARLNCLSDPPVLLHGDLWSGNVFWSCDGPVFLDPAVYYGNREADIAFTELFGGFSAHFYQGYNEAFPLNEGYPARRDIYNLYHIMTHANMFGGSYVSLFHQTVQGILRGA